MNTERMIRDAASKQAASDSRSLPKSATKREKSSTELKAVYCAFGYHLLICLHDRTYFEPCSACRRTKREGEANLLEYLSL